MDVKLAVGYDGTANTLAKIHEKKVPASRYGSQMAQCQHTNFLHQQCRQAPDFAHQLRQIDFLEPVEVGRKQHPARSLINDSRHTDQDAPKMRICEIGSNRL